MSTATIATKSLPASMHKVWIEAYTAAEAAAEACVPTPMVVGNAKAIVGPGSNEIDYSQKTYYVPSGVCGFAGVRIRPARGKFVAWLKIMKVGRPDTYYGGYYVPSYEFAPSTRRSQSYEVACAAANAAAAVLASYGLKVYVDSRLD
jgi:hypothetical protein